MPCAACGVAGEEAERDEQPLEREPEEDDQAERGQALERRCRAGGSRPANPIAAVTPRLQVRIAVSASARAASTDAAGDRQRPQPVDEALLDVLRDATAAPMPANSTPVATKPGTRKST